MWSSIANLSPPFKIRETPQLFVRIRALVTLDSAVDAIVWHIETKKRYVWWIFLRVFSNFSSLKSCSECKLDFLLSIPGVLEPCPPEEPTDLSMRRPFDPVAHDLDPKFRLTKYADLKGWGCKVSQEVLLKLLEGLQQDSSAQDAEHFQYIATVPRIGEFKTL